MEIYHDSPVSRWVLCEVIFMVLVFICFYETTGEMIPRMEERTCQVCL